MLNYFNLNDAVSYVANGFEIVFNHHELITPENGKVIFDKDGLSQLLVRADWSMDKATKTAELVDIIISQFIFSYDNADEACYMVGRLAEEMMFGPDSLRLKIQLAMQVEEI